MSKSEIYLAARTGSRASRSVIESAIAHFISTGRGVGPASLICEIGNHCLSKGWAFAINDNRDGTLSIMRAILG